MGFQTSDLDLALRSNAIIFHIKLRFKRSLKLNEIHPSYKDCTSCFISKEVMKTIGITGSVFKINLDFCFKTRATPPSPVRSGAPGLTPRVSTVTLHKLQVSPVSHGRAAGSIA